MKKFANAQKDSVTRWFAVCKKMQLPYVVVIPRYGVCVIEWDYTHFEKDIQKAIRSQATEVSRLLMLIFTKHRNLNSIFEGTALVGTMKGIDSNNAEKLANELFDLILKHVHCYTPGFKSYIDSKAYYALEL